MTKDKNSNQKIFHEAQQFHRLGALDQALELYKNLHESLPKEVLIINLIAQVYIEINRLQDAILWLKKSIKLNQSQAEAYLNLGSIFFQIEDWKASLENFNKVIYLDSKNVIAYFNRGLALKKLSLMNEALNDFHYALSLDKNNFEILNEIATTLSELSRYEDALKNYNDAIKINTNFPPLFFNRSLTLDLVNRHKDALSDLDKAIQLNPLYLDAINFRAIILGKLSRYEEALRNLDQAIQINPKFVEAFYNKATILQKLKRFKEAIINYEKAIDINPQYAEAFNNIGTTFNEMKRYEDAIINYEKAIDINPQYAEAYRNKAGTMNYLERFEDAIYFYDKAIELDPDMHEAYLNKSIISLRFCNFKLGWKDYEYRWGTPKLKKENISQTYLLKNISELGRIFLCEEQGIGDKILYASLLHELDNKNYEIFLETDERLLPIFKRSFNHIKIVSKKNRPDLSLFDSGFGIASLPGFLRKNIEAFKSQKIRFLESDQEKKINFRKILKNKSSKQICGLAWKSGNEEIGASKSIGLENFAKLSSLPNTIFVNLQYQASNDEIEFLRKKCNIDIINLKDVDLFNDIDSLFSLVDACDFVVTSSNVTVHIAGSLGKKSYLLIPNDKGKLWYWHDKHTRSIWYPSVQIFTQLTNSDWKKPLTDVYECILKEASFE
jgi:tetratricopeptide (TPR) repeat protein